MIVSTKAIVIHSLKYSDSSLIVKCFTEHDGIKSYLLRGVLASKKGKFKAAYFQPLTQLDVIAAHKNKGTLENLREVKLAYNYQTIHYEVRKNAIAFFVAEILNITIVEEEMNRQLYQFLETSLQWLDTHGDVANFPLIFLIELSKYLGFYPDTFNSHLAYFDLVEGEFVPEETGHPLIEGEELQLFRSLMESRLEIADTVKASKNFRKELLDHLITYYELHLQGFRKPRTLGVLHEVFS